MGWGHLFYLYFLDNILFIIIVFFIYIIKII